MLYKTIVTLVLAALMGAGAHAQPKGDDVLLEMSQAFKKGDRNRLSALLPRVRGHALEPWAAYWELKARLGDASAQEVQDFFTRYAGTYQEDRLRNDWLLLLGTRRDWAAFAAEYPRYRMNDDKEVRCYALLIEHLKAGPATPPELAAEVRRNWMSQRDADDGCLNAAARLIDAKKMTPADAWHRARLAIEANRPRAAVNAVELVSTESMPAVNELATNPARFLSARATANTPARKELVTLALIRMAASDADTAAAQLENKWGVQLTAEQRNWAWGVISKQSAQRLSNDALSYYAKAENPAWSDEVLGWKVRALLRGPNHADKWPQVVKTISAMSEEGRRDPTWIYWLARGLRAQGAAASNVATTALFESIASPRGFYEQLALEELGRPIAVPARPAPLTQAELDAAHQNAGLSRGLYAIQMGLRGEGNREWNYSTNLAKPGGMTDRELLAAAEFACEKEVWDRCINTSERTRGETDYNQRFPMPFRDAVVKRSREIGLDPAYVYGLIRQESRFIMDARSGVGASGLMQIMPATARWTAKKIGLTGFTLDQLNDRDTNIAIGTGYLKLLIDDFEGALPLAAAAYNAGPGRPRNWRNGPVVIEGAAWAENIPFNETRDYVKKVLANTTNYAAILSGQPQSLKARMGNVGPRAAGSPEPYKDLP
jgi:soluble lytic murein transglycosylase